MEYRGYAARLQMRSCGKYGAPELWGRVVGVEVWSAGVALHALQMCRYRARDERCMHADVEVWNAGVVLHACRYGGVEVWNAGVALHSCRYGGIELGMHAAHV